MARLKRTLQRTIESRIAEQIERECKLEAQAMGQTYPTESIATDIAIENRVVGHILANLFYGCKSMTG